jgi:tRNA A37 methylthiotransferase MiaB
VQLNSGARDVLDAVAGALLLRGGPVLGLDAWVSASDAVAAATSREAREDVLRLAALRAKLINLLDVRRQRLLFSPPNCFTQAFVEFLAQSTHSFQVTHIHKSLQSCRALVTSNMNICPNVLHVNSLVHPA